MWVPLARPLLGTWPATQACALTGNQTSDPLVHRPALSPLSHTSRGQEAFLNVVFSLGPSMVVRIVRVLILSTSFVIQKNAKNTLRTSERSSASSVTPTLNTRAANTTGCHMNILTVSSGLLLSSCTHGDFEFMLRLHHSLGLLITTW